MDLQTRLGRPLGLLALTLIAALCALPERASATPQAQCKASFGSGMFDCFQCSPGTIDVWNQTTDACVVSSAPTPPPYASVTPVYLGCFNDDLASENGERTLPLWFGDQVFPNMTIEYCHQIAVELGYPFFGLQYGGECHLGASLQEAIVQGQQPSTGCVMACSGNAGETCGNGNTNQLYSLMYVPPMQYIGCYQDNSVDPRVLPVLLSQNNASIPQLGGLTVYNGMTPTLCAQLAHEAGLKFFGLQDGNQCYAGNDLGLAISIGTSTGCTTPCNGDGGQTCGGGGVNDVYSIQEMPYAPIPLGCWNDNSGGIRALPYVLSLGSSSYFNGMTIELCAQLAQMYNYPYFGVQYADECFGGTSILRALTLGANDGGCTMLCQGNSGETCGNGNTNQLYSINGYVANAQPSYIGCYADCQELDSQNNCIRTSSVHYGDFGYMSPALCAQIAAEQGFRFFGVQNGGCRLENDLARLQSQDESFVCDTVCPGEGVSICGGWSANSVYSIDQFLPGLPRYFFQNSQNKTVSTESGPLTLKIFNPRNLSNGVDGLLDGGKGTGQGTQVGFLSMTCDNDPSSGMPSCTSLFSTLEACSQDTQCPVLTLNDPPPLFNRNNMSTCSAVFSSNCFACDLASDAYMGNSTNGSLAQYALDPSTPSICTLWSNYGDTVFGVFGDPLSYFSLGQYNSFVVGNVPPDSQEATEFRLARFTGVETVPYNNVTIPCDNTVLSSNASCYSLWNLALSCRNNGACVSPTASPSRMPTSSPTTLVPSASPSHSPSTSPSQSPTREPSTSPSKPPTRMPTASPTTTPSKAPSGSPTHVPTEPPTKSPTKVPSTFPTAFPTLFGDIVLPSIVNAQFSNDASSIVVRFSQPTNMRGTTGAQDTCFPWLFLQETCPGSLMDCGHLCSFPDPSTLLVNLNPTTDVQINANVTINATVSNIKDFAGLATGSVGGVTPALIMAIVPVPSINIYGAHSASLCGNDTTLQGVVYGSGGRPLTALHWYQDGVVISGQSNLTLTVNKPLVPVNTTFSLVATNWVGASASSSNFTIAFNNATVNITTVDTIQPQTVINIGCPVANVSNQVYTWTIYDSNGNDVTAQSGAKGNTSSTLITQPGGLLPGHYRILGSVAVGGSGAGGVTSGAQIALVTFTVNIAAVPVIAIIAGAGVRSINEGQAGTYIDASYSCDPNLSSPRCTSLGQVTGTPVTSSLLFAWSCFDASGVSCGSQLSSASLAALPLTGLTAARAPYVLFVTVTSNSTLYSFPANASTSTNVTVYVNAPVANCVLPSLRLYTFPARINVDPASFVALGSAVDPPDSNISWSQVVLSKSYDASSYVGPTGSTNRPNLVLLGSQLVGGAKYTFRVSATVQCAPLVQTFAEITFKTNTPPSGGQLSVVPATGYAAITDFTLSASAFEDADGDYPLIYSFLFSDGTLLSQLCDFQTAVLLNTRLPGPFIIVYAQARDSAGATSPVGPVSFAMNLTTPPLDQINVTSVLQDVTASGGSAQQRFNAASALASAALASATGANGSTAALAGVQADLLLFLNSSAQSLNQSSTATANQVVQQGTLLLYLSSGAKALGGSNADFLASTSDLGASLLTQAKSLILGSILGANDPSASNAVPSTLGPTFLSWSSNSLQALTMLSQSTAGRRRLGQATEAMTLQQQAVLEAQRGNIRALINTLMTAAIIGTPPISVPGVQVKVVAVRDSPDALGSPKGTSKVIVPGFDSSEPNSEFYLPSNVVNSTASSLNIFAVRFRFNIDELVSSANTSLDTNGPANDSQITEVLELGFGYTDGSGYIHPSNLSVPIGIKMPLAYASLPTPINGTYNFTCGFWDEVSNLWSESGCKATAYQLPTSPSDTTGWLLCECNHASDYAAWQKFVRDLETIGELIDYAHLSTILVLFVAVFVPVVFVAWLIIWWVQRRLDVRDASLVHLGAFVLITYNKVQMHVKVRKFFSRLRKDADLHAKDLARQGKALPHKPKARVKWYRIFRDIIRGLRFDHAIVNSVSRFDPYFGRTQRAGVVIAMFLGNLFAECFFFEFKDGGESLSFGFLIATTILAAFAVAIPVKLTIKPLFRVTSPPEGSELDRAVHIFRIASQTENIVPVGMTRLEKADLEMLAKVRKYYKANYRLDLLKISKESQDREDDDRARIAKGLPPLGSYENIMLRSMQLSGLLDLICMAMYIAGVVLDRLSPISGADEGLAIAIICISACGAMGVFAVSVNHKMAPAFMLFFMPTQFICLVLSCVAAALAPNYTYLDANSVLQTAIGQPLFISASILLGVALALSAFSSFAFFRREPAIDGTHILPRRAGDSRIDQALAVVTSSKRTLHDPEAGRGSSRATSKDGHEVRASHDSHGVRHSGAEEGAAAALQQVANVKAIKNLTERVENLDLIGLHASQRENHWLDKQANAKQLRKAGDWTVRVDDDTGKMDPKSARRTSFIMMKTHGLIKDIVDKSPDGRIQQSMIEEAEAETKAALGELYAAEERVRYLLTTLPPDKRSQSKKRRAIKKEKNPIVFCLRLFSDEASKRPEPIPKKLAPRYIYLAWAVLLSYYIFCIGWICNWVFQRDNATKRNFEDANITNANYSAINAATTEVMSAWIASAFVGVCIGYFAADPAIITVKFGIIPLIIRACERKLTAEEEDEERRREMEAKLTEAAEIERMRREDEERAKKEAAQVNSEEGKNQARREVAQETGKIVTANFIDMTVDLVESVL